MLSRTRAPRVALFSAALSACLLPWSTVAAADENGSGNECARAPGSALSQIACEVKLGLGPVQGPLVVVPAPLESDLAGAEQERLVSRIAALVARALGPAARAEARSLPLSEARRFAGRDGLVYLAARLRSDRLEVTSDLYPPAARFWARVKNPAQGALAHTFASRPLDAEVRSFLPRVPLVATKFTRVAGSDRDVVALACGDSDGNGSNELVLVGRQRISVGRVRDDRFILERRKGWNELTPVAPAPLREPIASAWIAGASRILIGVSDRAEGVVLDARLEKVAELGRQLPWPAGGCSALAGGLLSGKVEACAGSRAGPDFGAALDALAGAVLSLADGGRRAFVAGRSAEDGTVSLRGEGAPSARLEGAGAQLALGDLDGDGELELVSSLDTLEPQEDAVVVRSLKRDGRWIERLRVPVPSGVRALALCPLEGASMGAVAVATLDGLWLMR